MTAYSEYLEQQAAKQAANLAALGAILDAGQRLQLWAVLPDAYASDPDMAHMATHREVQTPDGGRYSVSLQNDRRAHASIASLSTLPNQRGIRMHASDVTPHGQEAPEASVALDRDPETSARSLHKRVIVPGALIAAKMRAEMAKREAMREALLVNVAAMSALGCTSAVNSPGDGVYYEAKLWHSGLGGTVRVTSSGSVYVERITVDLADVATLIGIAQ